MGLLSLQHEKDKQFSMVFAQLRTNEYCPCVITISHFSKSWNLQRLPCNLNQGKWFIVQQLIKKTSSNFLHNQIWTLVGIPGPLKNWRRTGMINSLGSSWCEGIIFLGWLVNSTFGPRLSTGLMVNPQIFLEIQNWYRHEIHCSLCYMDTVVDLFTSLVASLSIACELLCNLCKIM